MNFMGAPHMLKTIGRVRAILLGHARSRRAGTANIDSMRYSR